MSREPPPSSPPPSTPSTGDRLDSWKEIAAYLRRDVTTVQRWEKREGMPVHRHLHDKMGSVYALRAELDAWARSRSLTVAEDVNATPIQPEPAARTTTRSFTRSRWMLVWGLAALALLAGVGLLWRLEKKDAFWKNPIADAKFTQVTDLDGTEQAVAISGDGKFVAFLGIL